MHIKNLDRTLIIVQNYNGEKYVHYSGCSYFSEGAEPKPYRWISYSWFMCPLTEVLKTGVKDYERENSSKFKQHIQDLSEDELKAIIEEESCPIIEDENITADIPYGKYWIVWE